MLPLAEFDMLIVSVHMFAARAFLYCISIMAVTWMTVELGWILAEEA
jgi:hypothetical protein